jgi:hypothetical protein
MQSMNASSKKKKIKKKFQKARQVTHLKGGLGKKERLDGLKQSMQKLETQKVYPHRSKTRKGDLCKN